MSRGRAVLVILLCAVALAGCASIATGPDFTVPNDPAFTTAKLRTIDPCGLFDHATLSTVGTPSDNEPDGFDRCTNELNDNALMAVVVVGDGFFVTTKSATLAGMPVSEHLNGTQCVENVTTQLKPMIGITVALPAVANSCSQARALTTAIINRIRTNPPLRTNPPGSLATIDPCGTVDAQTLASALGSAPSMVSTELYYCVWYGRTDSLNVGFTVGADPRTDTSIGTPTPVSLGPITAYQALRGADTCDVRWATRPTGTPGQFEIVDISYSQTSQPQQAKMCATAATVAKVVFTKVPKPS